LTGLVGKAPELDLLIFQRLSAKTGRLTARKLHRPGVGCVFGFYSVRANAAKLGIPLS
jgi:hypothetical protein